MARKRKPFEPYTPPPPPSPWERAAHWLWNLRRMYSATSIHYTYARDALAHALCPTTFAPPPDKFFVGKSGTDQTVTALVPQLQAHGSDQSAQSQQTPQ